MRKLYIYLFTVLVAFSFNLNGQEIEISKDDFGGDKEKYKEFKKLIDEGDGYYQIGPGAYRMALKPYYKAYKLYKKNAALNYKIGNCYLHSFDRTRCTEYFLEAFKLDESVYPDVLLKIGMGYHLNYEFDKAIDSYKKYKSSLALADDKNRKENTTIVNKKIKECEVGKELVAAPVRAFIDNAGENVNSSYADYSPLISADESMMIFTSKRGTDDEPIAPDGKYYENIYISYSEDGGRTWSAAENIGKPLNDKDNNNATVGLSPDGSQLFVFDGVEGNGDILISELKGDEWSKPSDDVTKKYVNSDMHESSASFSFDFKTMYFDSNKDAPDEEFKKNPNIVRVPHDLYFTKWDSKKERWNEPKYLSTHINTQYDERGVFMHPDGRTIYFSSKGHNTMGGFDIFKSELEDDGVTWGTPVNLGYPINTPDDDVFFVMSASGKHGYYASAKQGGMGDYDIYRITFRGPEKPVMQSNEDNLLANTEPVSEVVMEESVEIRTMRLTILKGHVLDEETKDPLEADIEIVDNETYEVISVMKSNSSTGKYLVSLPSDQMVYLLPVPSSKVFLHLYFLHKSRTLLIQCNQWLKK
jgi:tetratricopeptide (TPR) repeat protein